MRGLKHTMLLLLGMFSVAGCMSAGGSGGAGGFEITEFGRPVRPSERARAYSHYMTSIYLDQQGQFEQSLKELESIPNLDPEAITPTLRLIRAHLRQRDFDKALEMAERAVEQAPDRSNLWIVLGEIYHQVKRYDEATKAFTKAIELNPDNVLGYGALVELQENTNDLVAAIDIYHRLIKLNPNSAGLHYQLGINLIRISDSKGAQEELTKALELSSSLVRAHYFLGVLALEAGEAQRSLEHIRKYLDVRPEDAEAQEMLGGALTRLGQYEEALGVFQGVLNGSEVQAKDYLAASYVALLADQPQAAEKLLPPDGAPVLSTLLQATARQAQGLPYQPLIESLDTVEGDINDEADAFLGDLLHLFGHEAAGQNILEQVRVFAGTGVQSKTLKVLEARTLMALERAQEAVPVLEDLLQRYPDFEWTHYYLAQVYDELKNFDQTELHLKSYLEKHPDDPDVLNFLAYLYAEAGVHLEEAEVLLKKSLAADPENPFYLDSLGWVYYKKGQADFAIDYIQRAIYRMDSDDAVLRDHLGDAYLLKGDPERAVSEWERAVRLDPKLEGVQQKIDQHRVKDVSALAR
ncbi:MAG: tetratricopeptide repeat protein [Candidatus Hydrogenedentes bacterium]|nr:tetratricopeptide repeat protein [Candidatus Hydrogenedentota bacterium]